MEISKSEVAAVEEATNESISKDAGLLGDLQLAVMGGGQATVLFG